MMVPKFPGSRTSSSATINWEISMDGVEGILKSANAEFGDVRLLILFKSLWEMMVYFPLSAWNFSSVLYKCCNSNDEFKNSSMPLMPSTTNNWCWILDFFCDRLLINFIWFFVSIKMYLLLLRFQIITDDIFGSIFV